MIDPEDLVEQRRRRERSVGAVAAPAPSSTTGAVEAPPKFETCRRLLAVLRGDRRPFDMADLDRALDRLALDEGLAGDVLRVAVDRALCSEGGSLRAWREALRRPRKMLGRGGPRP